MRKFPIFLACFLLFFCFIQDAYAVENPTSVPNNKFGIHILFPEEAKDAAAFVNSNGGDWGYVTIPIKADDKNIIKWQAFMDELRQLHLIPIIRIATEGDYFHKSAWRKPDFTDVLDFASFLNSLDWPTKNRYVVIFNEVNRGDEWGGQPNASEYAEILSYAASVFKERSQDFFIIGGGFDNAAPTANGFINQYDFIRRMQVSLPGIFNAIDGWASHSYPNPGFSQPPTKLTQTSISSFQYEMDLIKSLEGKELPVFITETGWLRESVSDEQLAIYFQEAFSSVWSNDSVVAVTPFLLKAGGGPFVQFSFINPDGSFSTQYNTIAAMTKTKGTPYLSVKVLGEEKSVFAVTEKDFTKTDMTISPSLKYSTNGIKEIFKWLLKI